MGKVDLHVHSTASDGRFSPEEIVRKAAELGLTVIALADHDSVDGIRPAQVSARAFPQLMVIPAVEISTDVAEAEVHVLGYFIDYTDNVLKAALERFRNSRLGRAQGMISKLKDLGIYVEWERVREIADTGSVGRPHIAQAMLEKGYIASIKDAFTKYIGRNSPAYVEREKITPAEAVELILKTKGMPVLAHPFTVSNVEAMIVELKPAGLVGIEAYYGQYTVDQIKVLLGLADKYGLIASGGSDYHGFDNNDETMLGAANVPVESATRLIALAEQRGLKTVNPPAP